MPVLSEFVTVKRRYSRSVNLERDFGISDSLHGYIPTSMDERYKNTLSGIA